MESYSIFRDLAIIIIFAKVFGISLFILYIFSVSVHKR